MTLRAKKQMKRIDSAFLNVIRKIKVVYEQKQIEKLRVLSNINKHEKSTIQIPTKKIKKFTTAT